MLDKKMQRLLDALVHTPALAGERSPRTAPPDSYRLNVAQLLRVITGYVMTAFGAKRPLIRASRSSSHFYSEPRAIYVQDLEHGRVHKDSPIPSCGSQALVNLTEPRWQSDVTRYATEPIIATLPFPA